MSITREIAKAQGEWTHLKGHKNTFGLSYINLKVRHLQGLDLKQIVLRLRSSEACTVLLHTRLASLTKGHKRKGHLLALELQQKNPSFCKLVQSNQVPAWKVPHITIFKKLSTT